MDDMARDYIAMGVVEDESEIRECPECGASWMPWQLMCEGCGNTSRTKKPEMWLCGLCSEEFKSERDAEECCAPRCFECNEIAESQSAAEACCSPAKDLVHARKGYNNETACGLDIDLYTWETEASWYEAVGQDTFSDCCERCLNALGIERPEVEAVPV